MLFPLAAAMPAGGGAIAVGIVLAVALGGVVAYAVCRRKRASTVLRRAEQQLPALLQHADCLLWEADVEMTGDDWTWEFVLQPSALSRRLFKNGLPSRDVGLWYHFEVPERAAMDDRSREALLKGRPGYDQEFRLIRDGTVTWLRESVAITRSGPGRFWLVGLTTDITALRAAEEANRASERSIEQLLSRADCLLWRANVVRQGDDVKWLHFDMPGSALYPKLFGDRPASAGGRLWSLLEVPELQEMNRRSCEMILGHAPGYTQEFRAARDGQWFWLRETVSIKQEGPDQWYLVGVITDVTARHEAEEARRTSEAQMRQVLELADCMVWQATVTSRSDGWLDWKLSTQRSVLYRRLFGDEASEASLNWSLFNIPERAEMDRRADNAIRSGASGYEQEFRVIQTERVIWLREVVTLTQISGGRWRLVGVITDITAQREAEEARRASEAQVQQILTAADCLLWQARVFEIAPGRLRWVMFVPRSRLHQDVFGCEPSDTAALKWENVLNPAVHDEINTRSTAAVLSGLPGYEQEFRAQRGERSFWLHEQVSIEPVAPGEWRLVGAITDMTSRREAEQTVRASEFRYRTLFQHTPVAIVEIDFSAVGAWLDGLRAAGVDDLATWLDADAARVPQGARRARVLDTNDTAVTMLRARSRSDFRRRRGALTTPDGLRVIRALLIALWEGRNTLEAQLDMRDFEGQRHAMNLRWWTGMTEKGLDLRQSAMVLVDLTDLKRAEAALAAEKERLAVTLRAMAEGVVTTDIDGRVQFMNPAAATFTDWNATAAIGRAVSEVCDLSNDHTGQPVDVPVARVARGDIVADLPPQTRLTARDGTRGLVAGCCAPIHHLDSRVTGMVLVLRDVTERERLEQELVRATRLESVGVLAGGIAHDFNNILTAVMGNLGLAAADVPATTEAGRSLRAAEKAALRARDLTQQLLTFAKGGEPLRAAVRLEGIIREMTAFALHGSQVKPVYDLAPDLWPAEVDKGQIGRVVQNLVINAVQAMPVGGALRIAARNERVGEAGPAPLAPGAYILIEITDTGTGIAPEYLERIFDPYFTTKQTGSGLGLAAVYSVVKKHQGHVAVESRLGVGTTFRVWLPASQGTPASEPPEPAAGPTALKGRVLFMDDEESIRRMAVSLMGRFGLDVVGVGDGAEAVKHFCEAREAGKPFSVVVMDLTVPGGMGGREAIARLREIDPNVKAIVSSGYSSDPVLANYRAHGFCGVVAKPYRFDDFGRVLRAALAEANGG